MIFPLRGASREGVFNRNLEFHANAVNRLGAVRLWIKIVGVTNDSVTSTEIDQVVI